MLRLLQRILPLWLVVSFFAFGFAQSTEIDAKNLVVLIEALPTGESTSSFGAGILLPLTTETSQSYIVVTAYHLVEDVWNSGGSIHLRTFFDPELRLVAEPSSFYDPTLDLAVLTISDTSTFPLLGITVVGQELERRTPLEVIGQGGQAGAWHLPSSPSYLSFMDSQEIKFESSGVLPGDSGGGIFTSDWHLLGMVTHIDGPSKFGVPLSRILEKLDGWAFSVDTTLANRIQVSSYVKTQFCFPANTNLDIRAEGTIRLGDSVKYADANGKNTFIFIGIEVPIDPYYYSYLDYPLGILMCKMDSESTWHGCGSNSVFEVTTPGCLEFDVNDKIKDDNIGAFDVQVIIQTP